MYKLKCSIFDVIYIGNTQHTFKKIMDGNFSDILRLLKKGKNLTTTYVEGTGNYP